MNNDTPKEPQTFRKKPNFIRQDVIALLMDIETKNGKIKRITHGLIKDLKLFEYDQCDSGHLKSMMATQMPDHTAQQLAVMCDLAWYGHDYQSMLNYLNPGSGYVSDFRGGWAERAFAGQGSAWIIGQYAMTAMKAEASKKQWSIGLTDRDWSRIVAASLKKIQWSDNFLNTGLSVSELLGKCDDRLLLEFLGKYDALADDQTFEVAYKLENQGNQERLWINFTPKSMNDLTDKAAFSQITTDQADALAVLKNGYVIMKSNPLEFSKAA